MNELLVGKLVKFTPGRYRSSLAERIGIILEIEKNFYQPWAESGHGRMDRLKVLWFCDDANTVVTWEPATCLIRLEDENVVARSE